MRFFPDFATIDLLLKLAAAWFLKFCILGIHTRLHSALQTRVCPHSLSSFAVFIIDLFSFAAEGASSLKSENLKMVEFNFRHLSFIRSSSGSLIASNILFSSRENPFPWSRCKKCSVWILWYFKGRRRLQEHCLFVCFSCAITSWIWQISRVHIYIGQSKCIPMACPSNTSIKASRNEYLLKLHQFASIPCHLSLQKWATGVSINFKISNRDPWWATYQILFFRSFLNQNLLDMNYELTSICSQPLLDNKVTWNSCQCHIFLQLYQLYNTSLFYRGHKPCSLTKCIYVTFIGKQTPTGWRLKGCRRCIMMIFSCHKCVTGKSMYWQYESYSNICLCQKASKCFPSHMNWQYRPYHNGTCKL